MNLIYYIVTALCLVIIQTTILPDSSLFDNFFDLLIPLTVYMGFFRPFHEGAPIVLFFGFIMDSLSGAPFGLYISTHVWLYFGARGIRSFLHVRNYVLMPLTIAAGVLLENLLFLGAFFFLKTGPAEKGAVFHSIGVQLFWAALMGTLLNLLLLRFQTWVDQWRKMHARRGDGVG
ncbi:MAG: hypothetical protein GY859_15495 [Desulfobacterales bacterium]|nr:hypothetical protein [Desulfobacterales bacterium]